jgi:hypothetical protein
MIERKRPDQSLGSRLSSVLALIWLAALSFYWLVDPTDVHRHLLARIWLSYLLLWSVAFLLSDESKTEMAHRFLLTSASVVLTVGLLEGLALAHIVDFRSVLSTPIHEPWRHPDNLLDPKLLHVHKPHYRRQFDGIDYRFDRHGLRNDVDLEAADIVVVGDSFIEGWNVHSSELLTSHLAKQLDRTVANLGQSWYGPQQELELLRRYGLPLHPKVCVWAFYDGNDLWDVNRYNAAARNWEEFSGDLHSFRQRSFTKNALLAVPRILASWRDGNLADDAKLKGIPSGLFEESDGRKTRLYFSDKSLPLSARDHEALEEVRSILRQAYELCRAARAKFLVVFVPTKLRIYRDVTEFEAEARPTWVINDLPKRIEAIVREVGGEFVDLAPALVGEAERRSLVYLPGADPHWSADGHRVAATAIARVLRQRE